LHTSFYLRNLWRRLTTTRRARTLEAELARERAANAGQGIEITRLRAENRALLNSILGIAGVPPLPATEADLAAVQSSLHAASADDFRTAGVFFDAPYGARPVPLPLGLHKTEMLEQQQNLNSKTPAASDEDATTKARRYEDHSPAARTANHSRPRANQTPHAAAPTRRRSWPQIHRLLEFESAQKEKPATDPLPPAFQ
jgi:hypothetical protein